MLEVNSAGLFSNDFEISNPFNYAINLHEHTFSEKAELTIQGTQFDLFKDGFGGDFVLAYNDNVIASAHEHMLGSRFTISHGGNELILQGHMLRSGFDLSFNDQQIGSVEPQGMFSSGANVLLPDTMPLEVQIFIAWLVLMMWRRQHHAASHAATM